MDGNIYRTLGNIGLGTPTPSEKLEVNGNTKITGNLEVTGNIIGQHAGCTLLVESNGSAVPKYFNVTVPQGCIDEPCLIYGYSTDLSSNNSVVDMAMVNYLQLSVSNNQGKKRFIVEGKDPGSAEAFNGDGKRINILKFETKGEALFDDNQGTETAENKWSVFDDSARYGFKIFVCDI